MNIEISRAEYYADLDVTQDSADTAPYISAVNSLKVTVAGVDLEIRELVLPSNQVMEALEKTAVYHYEQEGGWQQEVLNQAARHAE